MSPVIHNFQKYVDYMRSRGWNNPNWQPKEGGVDDPEGYPLIVVNHIDQYGRDNLYFVRLSEFEEDDKCRLLLEEKYVSR